MEKIYVSRARKTYVYINEELSPSEIAEHKVRNKKLAYHLRCKEAEDTEEFLKEHQNGYCPHCHTLLPMNGICECGYNVNTDEEGLTPWSRK